MARIPIPGKTHFFILLIFFISILIIDLGLQMIYYASRGRPTWSANEIFNFSDFTYLTNDERYVSIKPNFMTDSKGWRISTDNYGFRIGKQKPSQISNIVFLGDSVPFGWGVDSEDSVPSILHEILLNKGIDVGIINAAVPAYSLDQSVQRYQVEIVNKFPSNVIILQIYDPVTQFTMLGREWDVSINWTTWPGWHSDFSRDSCDYSSLCYVFRHYFGEKQYSLPEVLDRVDKVAICNYSSLCYLFRHYFGGIKDSHPEHLDIDDKIAISNYKTSIKKSLNNVHLTAVDTEKIFLLPVTVPKKSWSTMTKERKLAISILNSTLEEYAHSSDNILYVDTISLFRDYDDKKIFIDRCCHLSSFGAELQANLIAKELFNSNLKILQ